MSDENDAFRSSVTPHNVVANWGLAPNSKGYPIGNVANAVVVLQKDPQWGPETLWYDEFLDRIIYCESGARREWCDKDDTRLTVYMQQAIGMTSISEANVASAVRYVASQRTRHCVREYLHSLKWDGVERVAHALIDYWGAQTTSEQPEDYLLAVSANLFIGIVARVMRPGCQLDTMIILEGAQGIGKSQSLRALGGDWYMLAAESVANKDFYQTLPGKLIVELGELDALNKAERERTKIAISTPTDRYRSSYGRRAEDHPRQCVFVGTTNRSDYGNDETGLRRLWPVICGDIDNPALLLVKPQLFAEAMVAFAAGATWWETPTSTVQIQADRQHEDIWTPTVLTYVEGKDELTSVDILTNSALKLHEGNIGRVEQNRIATILTPARGWKRQTLYVAGRRVKGYKRIKVTEVDDV